MVSVVVTTTYFIRYKKEFLRSGIIKFFNTFVQFLPSIVIARVLRFVDKAAAAKVSPGTMVNTWEGVVWAAALFAALCMKTVLENQYFDSIITLGATIRGALSAAIYRKALRLSPAGKQANSVCMYICTMFHAYAITTVHEEQ